MSSSCRSATLKDWWPERETGVWRIPVPVSRRPDSHIHDHHIPLRPILFLFNDAMDSRKSSSACLSPVSMPETSICSHSTGTLSALKISRTDSETSAPMPSPGKESVSLLRCCHVRLRGRVPGIKVTVYLPPNLLGWKMSDVTVASASQHIS